MLEIAGHQIVGLGGVGTFEKNVIVRVGASPYGFRRPGPKASLANGVKRAGYDVITPSKPGGKGTDAFLVLLRDGVELGNCGNACPFGQRQITLTPAPLQFHLR